MYQCVLVCFTGCVLHLSEPCHPAAGSVLTQSRPPVACRCSSLGTASWWAAGRWASPWGASTPLWACWAAGRRSRWTCTPSAADLGEDGVHDLAVVVTMTTAACGFRSMENRTGPHWAAGARPPAASPRQNYAIIKNRHLLLLIGPSSWRTTTLCEASGPEGNRVGATLIIERRTTFSRCLCLSLCLLLCLSLSVCRSLCLSPSFTAFLSQSLSLFARHAHS